MAAGLAPLMTPSSALQPTPIGADRARLAERERDLLAREAELAALKTDLHELLSRYLSDIGPFYAELHALEASVADAEIRAGLRSPAMLDDSDDDPDADDTGPSCGNAAAPSDELKRVFRDLAKTIHPDLALDEPARCRRHSLMAEANRAYAERDEDRLRLILRAWERSPESVPDDAPDAEGRRLQRQMAEIDERLVAIEGEFADLRSSAIARLKGKIDEARRQGWDLFAEMILQVKREIARAELRLASAERSASRAVNS